MAEGADREPPSAEDFRKVPCRLFLPVVPAARVIGKSGASIRAIREQTGATVKILEKELPREMQRREDRVATIEGEPDAVQQAISAVLERVFDRSGLPEGVQGAERGRDRPHVVEVLVPEKSGSHFIGKSGERIRQLIEETGCEITVVKEPVVGLAEQKRIRIIASSDEEAAGAVWRLQEVLAELVAGGVLREEHFELREHSFTNGGYSAATSSRSSGHEVPVRVLIAKEEAAWVVGKRGNKITRLRDFAKVHMNDAESPPFDPSERVIEIAAASLESRLKALHLLVEDMALRPEAESTLRLLIPTEQFGSVMGHRGENIRAIMQSSGASLQQHKAEKLEGGAEYRLRLLEIHGSPQQQLEAARQAQSALESRGRDREYAVAGRSPRKSVDSIVDLTGFHSGSAPSHSAASSNGYPVTMLGGTPGTRSGATTPTRAPPFHDVTNGQELQLQLAMPSDEVARMLATDSNISWKAGVKMSVGRGAGGVPILQVHGSAVGNSVACYMIQDRLYMMQ